MPGPDAKPESGRDTDGVFIQYPSRKQQIPIRHIVPNLITTIALCCGLASMHYTLAGDFDRAILAVLLSAIFDSLDGRFARMLKAQSSFGAMLDSLADFLSFGVAPAMLLYQWMLKGEEIFGLAAVMLFVLCSALRLARFTAAVKPPRATQGPLTSDEQREYLVSSSFFRGMPTPAAAATVLIPPMLENSRIVGGWLKRHELFATVWWEAAVISLTFLVAILMISRVPMFSFKKMRVARWVVVPLLALVGLVVVLIVKDAWLAAPVISAAYLCTLPMSVMAHKRILTRPISDGERAESTPEVASVVTRP